MTDPTPLLEAVASLLRADASLQQLTPNWSAADSRGHVFVGTPAQAAANAGRAPYAALTVADLGRTPARDSDLRDAVATVTLNVRLVARDDVNGLAALAVAALSSSSNRTLGDAEHVLGIAVQRGAVEAVGPCEATDLRLTVRLLEEPGR